MRFINTMHCALFKTFTGFPKLQANKRIKRSKCPKVTAKKIAPWVFLLACISKRGKIHGNPCGKSTLVWISVWRPTHTHGYLHRFSRYFPTRSIEMIMASLFAWCPTGWQSCDICHEKLHLSDHIPILCYQVLGLLRSLATFGSTSSALRKSPYRNYGNIV